MASKLISEFGSLARRAEEADASAASVKLSDRELEVLRGVATGLSNEEIAQQLDISPAAVRNHVGNILVKLQLRSRIEAALLAIEARQER
jgi:two-component system NarL family response regulator